MRIVETKELTFMNQDKIDSTLQLFKISCSWDQGIEIFKKKGLWKEQGKKYWILEELPAILSQLVALAPSAEWEEFKIRWVMAVAIFAFKIMPH